MNTDVLSFWNGRAQLQEKAGSNDIIAKSIEIDAISKFFSDDLEVMEFGCGNGITALEMARRFEITVDAYDFSAEMIKAAQQLASSMAISTRVAFAVGDITRPPVIEKKFNIVFTERMIINLATWEEQKMAIRTLCGYLKPGGKLLLLENSATGLGKLNELRSMAGLKTIIAPWHNIYLDDDKVEKLEIDGCELDQVVPYSATYYFLSRVVNAWLAEREGKEPSYDAPVNELALTLPAIGDHAQGKIWVFKRK